MLVLAVWFGVNANIVTTTPDVCPYRPHESLRKLTTEVSYKRMLRRFTLIIGLIVRMITILKYCVYIKMFDAVFVLFKHTIIAITTTTIIIIH